MSLRPLVAACTVAALLACGSARAQSDDPPTPDSGSAPVPAKAAKAAKARWKPVAFTLDAGLRISHESNLYHVQRRHEADLAVQAAPYERFHGMKGPSDVEGKLSLDLAWRFKHISKRAITLRLRSRQHAFQDNEIANWSEFQFTTGFELTKKDTLSLDIDYLPQRFRKNRSNEAFPGIVVYERSDARQFGQSLQYAHAWTKKWNSTMGWGSWRRDYAAPFDERDADLSSWSVATRFKPMKRLALELGFERRSTRTGSEIQSGVEKDRSHDDDLTSLDVQVKLPHHWRVTQKTVYRARDYTTDVVADTSRFGRTDHRWTFGLDVEKKLKAGWTLAFDVSRLENDSGRSVTGPSSPYGYDDLVAGVSIAFTH